MIGEKKIFHPFNDWTMGSSIRLKVTLHFKMKTFHCFDFRAKHTFYSNSTLCFPILHGMLFVCNKYRQDSIIFSKIKKKWGYLFTSKPYLVLSQAWAKHTNESPLLLSKPYLVLSQAWAKHTNESPLLYPKVLRTPSMSL